MTIHATLPAIKLCFAVHEWCGIQFAASMQPSNEKLESGEQVATAPEIEALSWLKTLSTAEICWAGTSASWWQFHGYSTLKSKTEPRERK